MPPLGGTWYAVERKPVLMKYNIRGVSYHGHEFTDLPGISDSHEEGYLCREREEGVHCQRLDGWSGEGRKGRIEVSQGHRFEHR